MFDMFAQIMGIFLSIFKIPFIAVFLFIGYYVAAVFFWYGVRWIMGDRVKRGRGKGVKPRPFFPRLFFSLSSNNGETFFVSCLEPSPQPFFFFFFCLP